MGLQRHKGGPGAEAVLEQLTVNGEERAWGSNNHGWREKSGEPDEHSWDKGSLKDQLSETRHAEVPAHAWRV